MFVSNLLTYGWPGLIFALWLGLCVGSFLNVVIYRIPVMLNRQWNLDAQHQLNDADQPIENDPDSKPFNLMTPNSRCPKCEQAIGPLQNIPVLSWLFLGGKCKNCKAPIAARYPMVEVLTGILTIVVLAWFGFNLLGFSAVVFTWFLIALTFIDFDTQLLPDQMTLPLLWMGLLLNIVGGFTSLENAVIGAVAGYLSLWSVYWLFKLITGKEGMGYGDFKLLGAIGAWFGWQVLPSVILIASVVGLIYAVFGMVISKRSAAQPIAFGPFLAIAGWFALITGDSVQSLFLI